MWENLGVEYTKDRYGRYDDSPTMQEVRRRNAFGKPSVSDLQDREIQMEEALRQHPESRLPQQPAQHIQQIAPVELHDVGDHNPFAATLEDVGDYNPFQADPYTAGQPPAGYRDPYGPAITAAGQSALQHFMTPGTVAQA
jgi:hypothetical protein